MKLRIQKYLSETNICSRREAERWLAEGRIQINGVIVTTPGTMIEPGVDQIVVESSRQPNTIKRTIAFHKPKGIVSNLPVNGEKEITDLLPKEYNGLHTIGRLDKESEGLILLTNDGVLAKQALSTQHLREYIVTVAGEFTQGMADRLEDGMLILGEKTRPTHIRILDRNRFLICLDEGKNRQIRRMVAKVGLVVVRLKRVKYGHIMLGHLDSGRYRSLTPEELDGFFHAPTRKGTSSPKASRSPNGYNSGKKKPWRSEKNNRR
ncbi:rRNA pseudouridine synthase [bacterium]|nr:rRNA pseudouridine synthase [bacterium]